MAVLAFDHVVLGDLATPLEIFGRARDGTGELAYEVRVCSARPSVRTAHASLTAPRRLTWLATADTVIVPGLEDIAREPDPAVLRALRSARARGARVASICTGALVLAASGLLDGLRATTHWRCAAELARRHPRITVDPDVLYVDEGCLLTSAGAAAGLDLCLHMVRRDLGAELAARVARDAVMPLERAGGQAQFIEHTPPSGDGDIGALLQWIEAHLRAPLGLDVLARRAGASTRTLTRHFRARLGTSPSDWVARARVRRAQQLLETTGFSVERVAEEVGLRSASVLRAHFQKLVGVSPQDYRRSFRSH